MIPRVTHARLPEGRQDFKLRATGGVRLGETTNPQVVVRPGTSSSVKETPNTYSSRKARSP